MLFPFLIHQLEQTNKFACGGERFCFSYEKVNPDQSILSCRMTVSRTGVTEADKSQKEVFDMFMTLYSV